MQRKITTLVWFKFEFTAPNRYTLTFKAKDTNNHLMADKSVPCFFKNKSVAANDREKVNLIKKNITNLMRDILPRGYHIKYFMDPASKFWDGPVKDTKKILAKPQPIVKVESDLASKRMWQVTLINGNWTIVRAKNEYLSKQQATDLLLEKIQGQ